MEKIQESGDTKFRVCSRNQEKNTSDEENIYVKMAIKYNIEEILRNILLDHFRSLAIQAEIIGPGIQKNTCKLSDHEIRIFNIFDLKERRFFSFDELIQFKKETGLPIVNICESGDAFRHTIDELQHIANSLRYQESGEQAEGMVVRTKEPIYSQYLMSRLSFKVISENYLLKHNE
jgi:ATP-dependent RNA circularization protein (DNA/RNA ligase family)